MRLPLCLTICVALFIPAVASAQEVVMWGSELPFYSPPQGLDRVIEVDAAPLHTVALRADGTVVAWGDNHFNQCDVPAGLRNVVHVTTGGTHCLALKSDGTLAAWGDKGAIYAPPKGLKNVVGVDEGEAHSVAVLANGTVRVWGDNSYGQCNLPAGISTAVAVSGGSVHSLALKSNGRVVAWGDNYYGQSNVPTDLKNVVAVSAGWGHSLALRADGTVAAWGDNFRNQCAVPPDLKSVVAVAAGFWHSVALKSDGTVVVWGGFGDVNQPPAGLADVTAIAAGGNTVALRGRVNVAYDGIVAYAGGALTGKVILPKLAPAGGMTVPLASSDPTVTVPSAVTLAPGERTAFFPITADLFFGADRTVLVQPEGGAAGPLTVRAQALSLTPNIPSWVGGSTSQPFVTAALRWPLPFDVSFDLVASDPSVTVPARITITGGRLSKRIVLTHDQVDTKRVATLTADYEGSTVAQVELGLKAFRCTLTVSPDAAAPGASVTGKIVLLSTNRVPVTVLLSSSKASVGVPASVTVPAGAKEIEFPIAVGAEASGKRLRITATIHDYKTSAVLTVAPA